MVYTIVLRTHAPPSKLKSKIQLPRARVHIQLEPNPSGRTDKKAIFLENLKNTAERYRLFREPSLQAIARIEASLLSGARKYFEENLFVEVTVPHVTRATGGVRERGDDVRGRLLRSEAVPRADGAALPRSHDAVPREGLGCRPELQSGR